MWIGERSVGAQLDSSLQQWVLTNTETSVSVDDYTPILSASPQRDGAGCKPIRRHPPRDAGGPETHCDPDFWGTLSGSMISACIGGTNVLCHRQAIGRGLLYLSYD